MFTALGARACSEWYFDNGCSRHMTSDKSFFISLEDFNGGNVTFRDGSVAHWEAGVVSLFLDALS